MTSPLTPLISLPPMGPNNKEEGEVDKILFSVYNQLLEGGFIVLFIVSHRFALTFLLGHRTTFLLEFFHSANEQRYRTLNEISC